MHMLWCSSSFPRLIQWSKRNERVHYLWYIETRSIGASYLPGCGHTTECYDKTKRRTENEALADERECFVALDNNFKAESS